jgi:hypothetical protein
MSMAERVAWVSSDPVAAAAAYLASTPPAAQEAPAYEVLPPVTVNDLPPAQRRVWEALKGTGSPVTLQVGGPTRARGGEASEDDDEGPALAPWTSDGPLRLRTRRDGTTVATRGQEPDPFGYDRDPPGRYNGTGNQVGGSLWSQLTEQEREAWLAESPAEAEASRDGREPAGLAFVVAPPAKAQPKPERDWPKGLSELDRTALDRWWRLSPADRERSTMGPPVDSLERLARLGGAL